MIYEDEAKLLGPFRIYKVSQYINCMQTSALFGWIVEIWFPFFCTLKILKLRSEIHNGAVAEHHFAIRQLVFCLLKELNLYTILSTVPKFICRKAWRVPMELCVEATGFRVSAIRSLNPTYSIWKSVLVWY